MLVPGVIFSAVRRVDITAGAGQTPDFINQGFGFMNDGTLAVDTNAPSSGIYYKGYQMNASGAVHGTTTQSATDVYHEGVRRTTIGQLVYEFAAVGLNSFSSRNPVTANNAFGAV